VLQRASRVKKMRVVGPFANRQTKKLKTEKTGEGLEKSRRGSFRTSEELGAEPLKNGSEFILSLAGDREPTASREEGERGTRSEISLSTPFLGGRRRAAEE